MPHFKPLNIKISNVTFKVAKTHGRPMGQLCRRSLPGRLSLPMAGSHHVSWAQLPTHLLGRTDLQWLSIIKGPVLKGSTAR
jgi:hypothetical protein